VFGFLPNIGVTELVIILVLALLIFGPGKLPEVGKALGKGIREFKSASKGIRKELNEAMTDSDKTGA